MNSTVGVFKMDYINQTENLIACFDEQAFIGQSEGADIVVNDSKINGIHALLERTNNELRLVDLGSHYGTLKKKKRIKSVNILEYEPFQMGNQVFFLKTLDDKNLIKTAKKNKISSQKTILKKTTVSAVNPVLPQPILQASLFWGDKTLEIRSFEKDSVLTLGSDPESTFVVDFGEADKRESSFTIANLENQCLNLNLPINVFGLVWQNNHVTSIDKLRHDDPTSTQFGPIQIKLNVGDKAQLYFGELSLSLRFVNPTAPIITNWLADMDSTMVKITSSILILLLFLFLYIQFTPRPVEPPQTLSDIPQNLKRILFDSGSKDTLKKQQAAIGQLAQSTEGGRSGGEEGLAAGSANQKSEKADDNEAIGFNQKERTIGITKKNGQIAFKKSNLDIDSVFATNTKSASVSDTTIATQAPARSGNVVSKLIGTNYGKSRKGIGSGGGGGSVGIGQLKGNATGGGMGHNDSGLAPSKGLEINSNSPGNGGSDIMVVGGLDSDIIAAIIKRYLPQIQNCYEQQLVLNPTLKGKVTVAFTIGPDGSIKNQEIAESTLANKPIDNCLLDKIQGWKFPKPRGGGTVGVKYPFLLMSSRSR